MDRRLVLLFLTIFIDLMGFGIFIPVVPFVARDLGASDALVGDTAVVFSVLMYLFGPFWGAVSDRYGRRPVIAIAVAISGVSYLLFSFAHGIVLLFISRTLTGVGSSNIAAAQAYITDITPPEHRAKSLGLLGAAFGLGFIAGPPLGGVVNNYFGTAWVGYVAACLCLVNLRFDRSTGAIDRAKARPRLTLRLSAPAKRIARPSTGRPLSRSSGHFTPSP